MLGSNKLTVAVVWLMWLSLWRWSSLLHVLHMCYTLKRMPGYCQAQQTWACCGAHCAANITCR